MNKNNFIKMGRATKPHGIKGEVELHLLNQDLEETSLQEGSELALYPLSTSKILPQGEKRKILKLRIGNKVICLLEGIENRTQLEEILQFEFFLPREEFSPLEDDQVYLVDLVGIKVISPEGRDLGTLESFSHNGMQYLFDIRMKNGTVLTLPYVDLFFPELDMDQKTLTMILPEYTE